jgi:hypothetical protein
MNKGKEGLRFVAESSKKRDLGLVVEPFKKKKKNKKKKKKPAAATAPTPHVPFDICYTEEEWEELKGKEKEEKVEVTGVSGSEGSESPAGSSSLESPAPKARVSGPTHNDFAGKYNPHYVLLRDYYGDVYARYVGPNDGYIEYAIWVPKILVTN